MKKGAFALLVLSVTSLRAQLPFYTDDPAVTDPYQFHFEFFNEFDALQAPQFPSLRQNTANYKFNVGLPHGLEVDLDSPYLAIYRDLSVSPQSSSGIGDTNLGIKWSFHKETKLPALSASMYFEFPTGDTNNQLGSGLIDYWLNFIAQKHLTEKTRITGNLGFLFAGNTSTGLVGIRTTRGHVYTGGISVLREFTPKLTLGAEVYGGFTNNLDLGKSQVQVLGGGTYTIRSGFAIAFGLLGGKYIASPRIGGQIGFSVDFPAVVR